MSQSSRTNINPGDFGAPGIGNSSVPVLCTCIGIIQIALQPETGWVNRLLAPGGTSKLQRRFVFLSPNDGYSNLQYKAFDYNIYLIDSCGPGSIARQTLAGQRFACMCFCIRAAYADDNLMVQLEQVCKILCLRHFTCYLPTERTHVQTVPVTAD